MRERRRIIEAMLFVHPESVVCRNIGQRATGKFFRRTPVSLEIFSFSFMPQPERGPSSGTYSFFDNDSQVMQ
jgi:hypothetical protein